MVPHLSFDQLFMNLIYLQIFGISLVQFIVEYEMDKYFRKDYIKLHYSIELSQHYYLFIFEGIDNVNHLNYYLDML